MTSPAPGEADHIGGGFLVELGWDAADVERVLSEYQEVAEKLTARYADTELFYPQTHGVEAETSAVLYGLGRLLKPQSVVETGVADGRSSWLTLAALERNGSGMLHSFDINHTAGRLVGEHPQWRLEILDRRDPEASLGHALERVGSIDLFFHDSDHLYLPQLFEYGQAWPRMTQGGVFASDASTAAGRSWTSAGGTVNVRPFCSTPGRSQARCGCRVFRSGAPSNSTRWHRWPVCCTAGNTANGVPRNPVRVRDSFTSCPTCPRTSPNTSRTSRRCCRLWESASTSRRQWSEAILRLDSTGCAC
ncbi:class I SAM-dependent methyltransferase [Streptomyces sp. T1317-0309]|nr:class I SAM-dependent methyltransferase [Streptomyces sp. T1317-0309]